MWECIKFTAIDPHSGRQRSKSFSTKRYKREEINRIGNEWIAEVKAGKHPFNRPQKKSLTATPEDDSGTGSESEEELTKSLFKFDRIDDIDIPDDKFGVSFCIVGTTRSGKSTLMLHLWNLFFKGHICLLHTGSHQSEIYKPLAKACITVPFFGDELIRETTKINSNTNNHYKFLQIIDDIVDKKNNKEMTTLLCKGRNSRQSVIVVGQELSMLNAIGRTNINFVCLMKMGNDLAVEKVIKQYLRSAFPSEMGMNDMIKIYKHITENHGFFVCDNLNDRVFISRLKNIN